MNLLNPRTIKALLSAHNLHPNHALGQNFLVSKKVLDQLVEAAGLEKDDTVIEVGAGLGIVTCQLAQKAKKVIAYEIDRDLAPILKMNLSDLAIANVEIRQEDALKGMTVVPKGRGDRIKVVGAIPYQISSPLVHLLVNNYQLVQSATFIMQKEVAQKLAQAAPKGSYLSNFTHAFATVTIINSKIKPAVFWPSPKVDSAMVRIEFRGVGGVGEIGPPTPPRLRSGLRGVTPQAWSEFLHKGFSKPRKMLKQVFAQQQLISCGIDPQLRAQELTLNDWLDLLHAEK